MEQIKPTQFKRVNTNEMPNAEQLLCGKALDAVIALGLFDTDQFDDVNSFSTNQLLNWCVEVLTAHEFNFFQKGEDVKRNELVDAMQVNFEIDCMLSLNLSYEMIHQPRLVYESFFIYDQDLLSIDEQMKRIFDILTEKEAIYQRMVQFRESWSLQTFIHSQNTTNPVPTQSQDSKISADESKLVSVAVSISSVTPQLVTKETYETSDLTPKRKASPKKESASEKAKKHKAMSHNARRRAGGMNLTKGYMIMPKDRAVFQQWTGTYAPTIKINNSDEFIAFDFEFPPETREHGFMISFKGETQYWNATRKNFQTEIISIKI